jgi:hypothetical protein
MRAAALVVAIALAGCGDSAPATTVAVPSRPACDRDASAYRVKGRPLKGDVDGDGRADRVTLRVAGRRPPRCRHLLVVEPAAGATVTAAVKPLSWPGTDPRLLLLAGIDGRDGVEPVVSLSPAAVYRPGAVFTLRGGRLARMRVQGLRPANLFPLDDEFPADVDCAPERGKIVITLGEVGDPDSLWDIERTTYRARRLRFRRIATERFQVGVGTKVGGAPFRSCERREPAAAR